MTDTPDIRAQLIDAIASWDAEDGALQWSDERFNALARSVFEAQFRRNPPFRRFCEGRGVTPRDVDDYREIPAVPTDVFKHVRLSGVSEPTHTFKTSGTTVGERGEHHFASVDVYQASLRGPFRHFCLPDRDQMRMLIAAPPAEDLPDSSLSFMLSELIELHGDAESAFYVRREGGELDMKLGAMADAITRSQEEDIPVFLLGTAFAFAELLEAHDTIWNLPPGSRVMETGGFKGKSKSITRDELYEAFSMQLGIPESMCVSEYSMTELSSQAYTADLRRQLAQDRFAETVVERESILYTPPWVRVELMDPRTLEPLEGDGARGLICWYDLANIDSVVGVQTTDIGTRVGDGFRLEGRAPDADLRGCSLTIEEIVEQS
ncbi:MAG: hypothetical protein ACQEVA_11750 [Myxococcota bacterium]